MRSIRLSISAFALGALLGLPATAARAAGPTTVEEAQAAAQAARDRAHFYSSLGGVGYKTGLERTAQAEAARYDAKALELCGQETQASAAETPNPSCTPTKPAVDALCNFENQR
jgi:hypothetical protein